MTITPSFFQDCHLVTSFADAERVLRSKEFVPGARVAEESGAPLFHDVLPNLTGDRHFERRRCENPLFSRDALDRYENRLFVPSLEAELARIGAEAGEGPVAFDLLVVTRRPLLKVAAALVGLDGVETREDADELRRLAERMRAGLKVRYSSMPPSEQEPIVQDGLAAKDAFSQRFLEPSLERRRGLLNAGKQLDEMDLLTILLMHGSATWDREQIHREAITFMNPLMINPSEAAAHTVAELTAWLDCHPADRDRLGDSSFLGRAALESIRLHPMQRPFPIRRTTKDVVLGDSAIAAGRRVAIDLAMCNRDQQVFGPNGDRFDPFRPGLLEEGGRLAFGGGPHKCMGRSLTLGPGLTNQEMPLGLLTRILQALYVRGVEIDPQRHAELFHPSLPNYLKTFPVRLLKWDLDQ
jgi:cytochrome P450